jgi:hypothetical protein
VSGDNHITNPVFEQMELLLTGYGYNFYSKKNQTRSDDQLVRQKATASLGEAGHALAALQSDYQQRYVPPATRENPYPPAAVMRRLRDIAGLRERIGDMEVRIRGMAVPSSDKVWRRYYEEQPRLNMLLDFDYRLLTATGAISLQARGLTAEACEADEALHRLDVPLRQLDDLIRARQQFLQLPT